MGSATIRRLELAHEWFWAPISAGIIDRLPPAGRKESAARFVRELRLAEIALTNLAARRSWRSRLHFLWKNLFPSRAHMHATYKRRQAVLLTTAYLHRIVRGTSRWFRRPATTEMDTPATYVRNRRATGAADS